MPYKRIQGNIQTQVTRSQQVLHFFNLLIYHASHMLELILAGLLTVALLISMLRLFPELLHLVFGKDLSQSFTEFLEVLFTIVVGVEALKMLCKHTPGSALEVLLFAMARSIVVYHTDLKFIFIGILAIAVIFATRKYLYVHDFDTKPEEGSIFAEIEPDEPLFSHHHTTVPHDHQPHVDDNGRPVDFLNAQADEPSPIDLHEPEGKKTLYPPCTEQSEDPEEPEDSAQAPAPEAT